ncbi:3940_t:CDS:2 [Acaulospora morrowiae]|uniref:Vezatin n=1 Tax=Acaulospora morrowiae TaxID=94023 RepID=A0A9N8ZPI2_9GLOM|nr:3940_t:CDS:2 [Acaulospora morrowiae]
MAEALVYEDTPFAEYLSEIGSKEELTKQPEMHELERRASQNDENSQHWLAHFSREILDYLQETLSTALPLQEENAFEERFKYLLCTSHLLNDTLSIYFYDSKKPNPINAREAGLYFGGISRRNFEILLSSLIGVLVVLLTWLLRDAEPKDIGTKMMQLPIALILALLASFFLYRRMRRKVMKNLHNSALHFLETLVYNCQTFDLKVNKALIMIQEIELVSRGYRLSMPLSPISRIEQSSKDRRCNALREAIYNILQEAFTSYCEAIVAMQPEISKINLDIMYNMYNITPCPDTEGDEWNVDDEKEKYSLEYLKQIFQRMHSKRRECLCHFLALDVMTPGRDSHRRDYEYHWAAVNGHLDEIGVITSEYLNRVNVALASELHTTVTPTPKQDFMSQPTAPVITNKKLKAYLHRLASIEQHIRGVQAKVYICNEDARKYFGNDGLVAEKHREQLLNQYESITRDFTYMFQEWEDGKKALKDITEPMSVDSNLSSSIQSLDEDAETLKGENDSDENTSEKTLTIDWSQKDEPLDVQEQVFVAEAITEQTTKKLTREERIAIQKVKRDEEAKSRATRMDSERMVHELKDVLLVRRKPMDFENEVLQPSQDFERIPIQGTRVEVVSN